LVSKNVNVLNKNKELTFIISSMTLGADKILNLVTNWHAADEISLSDNRYMDGPKTNKGTGAGVYKWRPKQAHSFSFGFYTMLFQAKYMPLKHRQWRMYKRATQVGTLTF
jgi:hypothetical protein